MPLPKRVMKGQPRVRTFDGVVHYRGIITGLNCGRTSLAGYAYAPWELITCLYCAVAG